MAINLTKEEKKMAKKYLYKRLMELAEYYEELTPKKCDSLDNLVEKYCYWADELNDGYMPESEESDRISEYVAEQFELYR